mmetsp:Transcript_40977/g.103225  ORF Transcript_40977/g.103225 Transcript_40977/m.103225 type:complete len:351 (-) Transcript_40977:42-1094(-)
MSAESEILFINFNQDASCISVGLKDGFRVYTTHPFSKTYHNPIGGICCVQMLYCSSLIALVGNGDTPVFSPRKLHMYNTKTNQPICELNFVTAILSVHMNRKRAVVVMETKIHIYEISNLKILHTIDTVPNPKGICALSSVTNSYLAYPGNEPGEVYIFDALSLRNLSVITAHKRSLSYMKFNSDGTLLATASEKGTVIRVFSVPEAKKSFIFRRGAYPATVHCINFSEDSKLLCASSDTGTVHLFKIDESTCVKPENQGLFGSYLPGMFSDMIEPWRSFSTLKIPSVGVASLCCFTRDCEYVVVVAYNGFVYTYKVAEGESKMVSEHYLLSDTGTTSLVAPPTFVDDTS